MVTTVSSPSRARSLALPLLAVAAVVALYAPAISAPFEYDDKVEILANRVLRDPQRFWAFWDYNPFRVLLMYSFALDQQLFGFRVEGYRAVNIAVHALNSVLLWALTRRLAPRLVGEPHGAWLPALATLTFAVHPLAIESVTYISGRSSALATSFALVSLLAWTVLARRLDEPIVGPAVRAHVSRLNAAAGVGALCLALSLPAVSWARGADWPLSRALALGGGVTVALAALAAALLAGWWRSTRPPPLPQRGPAWAAVAAWVTSLLAFALGALTKEVVASLPTLLLLLDLALRGEGWRATWAALRHRLVPFFAIPLLLLLGRLASYGAASSPDSLRPLPVHWLTQVEVLGQYARLWLVPWPLSIYHDYPEVLPPGSAATWALALLWLALVVVALRTLRRVPAVALGIGWVAASLSPTLLIPLKETMVEHRTYLPTLGVALIVGQVAVWTRRRLPAPAATALALAWLALLGGLHLRYNRLWSDEEALWLHAAEVNPASSDVWRYIGDLRAQQGHLTTAEGAFRRAIEADPDNAEALNKLGRLRAMHGDLQGAEKLFEAAVEHQPCLTAALNNLALARLKRHDVDGAIGLYQRSVRCDDEQNPIAHRGLGDIYAHQRHNPDRAITHYGRALEQVDPLSPEAAHLKRVIEGLSF